MQWGKLFQVMQELGLSLSVEVPEPFAEEVNAILEVAKAKRARTVRPRPRVADSEAD